MKRIFTFISLVLLIDFQVNSTVFTVSNTNDSGAGSLREAITFANYTPGSSHTIVFNIPVTDPGYSATSGVWTIHLQLALPYITKSNITIDGATQTLNQGNTNIYGPEIQLDGSNYSVDFAFSVINVSEITIKGFCITNCTIGIQVYGTNAQSNSITDNYIGINPAATDTAGNDIGIEIIGNANNNIIGGSSVEERNIVSGNSHIGIRIVDANFNYIKGNYVGTDRTGTFALGNYDGISIEGASKFNIVGGYAPEEGNLVSGNIAYGIPVFGAGADENIIAGNLIGTDYSGTQAIPNTYGVLFDDGAKYNIVGGSQPGATNIISGNSGYGVFLYNLGTKGNIIKGNLIGTDFSGTSAVPNANGIVVDGAAFAHVIDSNTISGNLQQGIAIHITGSDSTIITRNFIGTDITGTLSLPNGNDGIRIAEGPKFTQIGGSLQLGNIIAHNLGNGITIGTDNDDYNRISANSIHHNTGLGIELFPPGPTINDAGDYDTGPNQGMNYPVIDSTVCSGDNVTIYGSIDTQNPQNITIELFESDNDGSGYGEGLTFLGSTTPSDIGLWSYTLFSVAQLYLCATATDEAGNTSEFSQYIYINPLSINENDKNVQINIYPNPFYEIINIDVRLIKTSNLDIKIYNSLGGEIYSMSSDYSKGMQNLHIHLPGINAGIYFMSLSINDRIYEHFKLVKILHNTE